MGLTLRHLSSSLALISARQTVESLQVVSMLIASYLYVICQALDLRALQHEFSVSISRLLTEDISAHLTPYFSKPCHELALHAHLMSAIQDSLDATSCKDAKLRMEAVAAATTAPLMAFLSEDTGVIRDGVTAVELMIASQAFRASFATGGAELLQGLRCEYLTGERGPAPAAPFLGRTRPVYVFIRETLGIPMHGLQNYHLFEDGFGDILIGGNVTKIFEAIRDGEMQNVIARVFHDA